MPSRTPREWVKFLESIQPAELPNMSCSDMIMVEVNRLGWLCEKIREEAYAESKSRKRGPYNR